MKKIALFLLLFCLFLCTASFQGFAAEGPLDEIQSITIDAQTSSDGVVTLRYDIAWKVLDSESEGPLSWVQIGVPNSFYEVTGYGGDAVTAYPYNSSEEDKVRVDFKREFFEGETAVFHFTIRQYYLLELVDETNRCDFIPGWFEDIAVKKLTVKWRPDNVASANTDLGEEYYEWSGALEPGEHFATATTFYSADMVITSPPDNIIESGFQDEGEGDGSILFLVIFIIIIGPIIFFTRFRRGGYRGGRGFWFHGGHGGGCACACAGCACACACAGGGRAGCAQKDFTSFEKLSESEMEKSTDDGAKSES